MQQITIIGNVGNEPEIKYLKDGIAVCNLSVAVAGRVAEEGGERETTWYAVTFWRKTAELVVRYVHKGNKIWISGKPGLETYQGRDGKTHAKLTINATEVEFLTPKAPSDQEPESPKQFLSADIPF